jgi:hypothetical protein
MSAGGGCRDIGSNGDAILDAWDGTGELAEKAAKEELELSRRILLWGDRDDANDECEGDE